MILYNLAQPGKSDQIMIKKNYIEGVIVHKERWFRTKVIQSYPGSFTYVDVLLNLIKKEL